MNNWNNKTGFLKTVLSFMTAPWVLFSARFPLNLSKVHFDSEREKGHFRRYFQT